MHGWGRLQTLLEGGRCELVHGIPSSRDIVCGACHDVCMACACMYGNNHVGIY